jgi:hypothetical protein
MVRSLASAAALGACATVATVAALGGSDLAAAASPRARAATLATLSGLRETNAVFAVGRAPTPLFGQTAARRHAKGTTFSFGLDQPALVNIAIETTAPGRRVGRRCRPASPRLRRRPRCTLTVRAASLIRNGRPGPNRVAFSGRAGQIVLDPGHYLALFTAVDAAGASPAKTLRFTVVKR